MDRYLIKINDSEHTIPKENIVALALVKALDLRITGVPLKSEEQAVRFLESLGMEISEVTNDR